MAKAGLSKETSYSFEHVRISVKQLGRARHVWQAEPDVEVLCQRLGLSPVARQAFQRELTDFVIHHHLNVNWYDHAITWEVFWRWVYFGFNLALLAGIPIGTLVITQYFKGGNIDAITAILTGLLGVQRALSAWLDKRQLVALYTQTRAKLKGAVYGFEQAWRDVKLIDNLYPQFKIAIRTATEAARQMVDDERDAHYAIDAAPSFDVGTMLTSAAGTAKSLTDSFGYKEPPELAAKRTAEKQAREAEALIAQFQALSIQYRNQLNQTNDPAEKQQLLSLINDNNAKQRAAELDRAVAMAKLQAAAA